VTARAENYIKNPDNYLLRDLYGVKIRNESHFRETLDTMTLSMPNKAYNLNFDLVIREYNEEGVETHPGQAQKEKQVKVIKEVIPQV